MAAFSRGCVMQCFFRGTNLIFPGQISSFLQKKLLKIPTLRMPQIITTTVDTKQLICCPLFYLKVLELGISIVCIGLSIDQNSAWVLNAANKSRHAEKFIFVAYASFAIISVVQLFGRVFGGKIPNITSMAFCLIGGVMFLSAGGIQMSAAGRYYLVKGSEKLNAAGTTGLIGMLLFLVDAGLSFFFHRRGQA